MLTALVDDVRHYAAPGLTAICPECLEQVQPRCGSVVSWHFAHIPGADCEARYEPETEWHRSWKRVVPIERCEVIQGGRRADLLTSSGEAVELQRLSLSLEAIRAREQAHGRLLWIVNCQNAYDEDRLWVRPRDGYYSFHWQQPARWWLQCRWPVLLDLGDRLLNVRKVYNNPRLGGWGRLLDRWELEHWVRCGEPDIGSLTGCTATERRYVRDLMSETLHRILEDVK